MDQGSLRLAGFVLGLLVLLSWELAVPHHPPTAGRARRWLANLGLAAINGLAVSLLCATCLIVANARLFPWRVGLFEVAPLPLPMRIAGEILALDLLAYLLHRGYHRVPILWRFHAVHHSDHDLDATSASRFHLGEVAVSAVAKLGCVLVLGISAGGLVAFELLMLLAAQFQHANVRLPARFERLLWLVLVPPAMHRVHHHPDRTATDSNYGTLLSVWDRAFRTLRRESPSDRTFGLKEFPDPSRLGLGALLVLPAWGWPRRKGPA